MQINQNINKPGNQAGELIMLAENLKNAVGDKDVSPELAENYAKMAVELENMSHKFSHYFERDDDGKMPIISLEARDTLLNHCKKIAEISEKVTNTKPNTRYEKTLLTTTNIVQDLISKDMKALIKMKEPQTLSSVIQNGRRRVIDISNQVTGSTGGNVSERIIIKDGGKDAFFTQNKRWDKKKELEAFTNKYTQAYPQYSKFFKAISKEGYLGSFNSDRIPVGEDTTIKWEIENGDNREKVFFVDEELKEVLQETKTKDFFLNNINNEEFRNLFFNFCNEANTLNLQINMNEDVLRLGKNEPVDERNAGMSIIAGMLGCNTLLAHSEPITLIKDGKEIQGTLMDKAEGIDMNNVALDDESRFYTTKALGSTQCKKQLADLQIIDFICGNIDRHAGNMFMSFDKSDPKNVKVNKIVGIDNDLSFTSLNKGLVLNGANYMGGLNALKVMTESMAEKIKTTTPAMLKLALRGLKIESKAIDQMVYRYNLLQEMVKDRSIKFTKDSGMELVDTSEVTDPKQAKINIVPDEKWEKIQLSEAMPDQLKGDNIEKRGIFKSAMNYITGLKGDIRDIGRAKRAHMETTGKLRQSFVTTKLELPKQLSNLKKGSSIFRGTTEQYENIKKQIGDLARLQADMGGTPTHEQINQFCQELNGAIGNSQAYLDRKANEASNGKKFGRYTNKRIKVMQEYNKYLTDKLQELKALVKKDEKAKVHESNVTAIAKGGNVVNPDQVKQIIANKNLSQQVQVNVNKEKNDVVKGK